MLSWRNHTTTDRHPPQVQERKHEADEGFEGMVDNWMGSKTKKHVWENVFLCRILNESKRSSSFSWYILIVSMAFAQG